MDEERQFFIASVISLANGKFSSCSEDGTIIWKDGATDLPTDAEIEAERLRLEAEYDTQEYARKRQAEYPDWGTQLEKIDDDGLTRWREEMIDPIKSKWPKDNSGPK